MTHDGPDAPRLLDLAAIATAPVWDRVASAYADHIAPHLALYADDALRLAALTERDRALDVATGPGTLALRAARVAQVRALDFSAGMIEQLRRRAEATGLKRLIATQGDGQHLPYPDETFDVAFSMFGLFLFPDRAKGFAELHRVLKPGGRAVVASWKPQSSIPAFAAVNAAIAEASGAPPDQSPPLADPESIRREMSAAGFAVEVHESTHTLRSPSLEALWSALKQSHVALRLASDQLMPAQSQALYDRIYERLYKELGTGAQEVVMPAWLGLGRK